MLTIPSILSFAHDRPFFPMVVSFLVSAVGLGPVFDKSNPLGLDRSSAAFFAGKVQPNFAIDLGQIRDLAAFIGSDVALRSLCCMLVNTGYESVKDQNDRSPEFELFRHIRNAASHGNRFFFRPNEPSRPAAWRGVIIDHTSHGTANPLHDTDCFGGPFAPADAILLLWDIEQRVP